MKISEQVKCLLFEAYRRNDMADVFERRKPLGKRWLGCGSEDAYQPAITAGLMVFHDGRVPPPKCNGWLILTSKGIRAMNAHKAQFAAVLAVLKTMPVYQESYRARFMLAGALDAS